MKRTIAMVLALCIVAMLIPMPTSAAVFAKGRCGQAAYWELGEDGTLTIYGSGAIDTSQTVSFPPWKQYSGKITSIVIKEGITVIHERAFENCLSVTSVLIADSVTTIGDYAFYRCGMPSEVVLPSKLESLGAGAFADTCIQTITIPETVTTVSSSLFDDCDKLTSVTFKGAITDIGAKAFYSCEALETVTFEKGFSGEIKSEAFAYCEILKEIAIPEGVTRINDSAFTGCKGLTSITLPESLQSIWSSAFSETGIVSVTIPKAVEYMGSHVFSSCDALKNITMYTETVENLKGVLGGGTAMEYVHIIGDAPQTEDAIIRSQNDLFVIYYDEGTSGWVPPTWKDNLIEIWGKEDLSKTGTCGEGLTWLLKDGTLTISGTGAMDDYSIGTAPWYIYSARIHNVVIESGVESLGSHAFYKLYKLESVTIPGSVKTIGSNCFWDCTKLKEVDIPEGVESIGDNAFWWCSALTSVTMADSVTSIGSSCFSECDSLTTVKLSEGLSEIPAQLFNNSGNITTVDIPANITIIQDSAFSGCVGLSELLIPDGVTSIGGHAFRNSGLIEITIPSSVKTIGALAFVDCTKLQRIRFQGDAPEFGTWVFHELYIVCIYPGNNDTWTDDVKQDYGGTVTWITDDHAHAYETIIVEPTCTEQGYHGQRCSACGHTNIEGYTDPLGHDMAEASCAKPSTCRRENCGYSEGSTTDHIWENPCLTTRTCSLCGHTDNGGGHDWDNASGEARYCYACGAFEGGYLLDLTEIPDEAWIDGVKQPYSYHNGFRYMILKNADAKTMVIYSYANLINQDRHTQYPTGMKVWRLTLEGDRYKATYIAEFENLLQYAGSSIRITGTKGIRMITSIEKSKKQALTGDGLAGYKLVEYGTALCWAKDLDGGKPMVLGQDYVKSNYAYKKGVADPVFAQTNDAVQYTNVLVGFSLDQCKDDIAMRPYIILEDKDGTQITIYGGIVYRSIGYIAYQNRTVFAPGNASYNYVWEIVHHVYGNKYDAEYKG